MNPRRLVLLAAATTAATALAAPAADAATPSSCASASKTRGVTRVAAGPRAVVFTRDRKPVSLPDATLEGCAYGGRVFKLAAICCGDEQVKLAGTFLFYAYRGSAIGDETQKLGLYDLRTGRRLKFTKLEPNAEGPDPEIETYSTAYSMTVTSKGSVAWIVPVVDGDENPTGAYELRIADGPKRTEHIADTGKLDKRSLKLSRDEKTLTYRKDGVTKTVAIQSP